MLDLWQHAIVVAVAAAAAAATGLLRTDPDDDRYIDFWAPERRTRKRWTLALIHAAVGAVGAVAAIGLEWEPSTSNPWWPANGLIYATASVAVFRADVSGFKLGTATTGRSLLKLVETRMQSDLDRRTRQNITQLVDSASNDRLVATAYLVLERVYNTDGTQIGYRELTADIENAARVFDPNTTVTPSPPPHALRAWIVQFVTDGIANNQLIFDGHDTWEDAQQVWDEDQD